MSKTIRIGTRDSQLALVQTDKVVEAIKTYDPTLTIEIIKMKTTGDKILDVTLDKIGGKGLFVKELDDALRNHEVDITVHSYKDMPMEVAEDLPIVAISKGEDPRDVLIRRADYDGEITLIGSSSKRRTHQLQALGYRHIKPLRGNVITRLKKLDSGEFDAIVLAAAGIKRLGLEDRISYYFHQEDLLPAAAQGVIAVQGRAGEDFSYLRDFHSIESEVITAAERSFVRELGGGCSSPIAAHATLEGDVIFLRGMYVDEDENGFKDSITGKSKDGEILGKELAKIIKEQANEKR